MASAEMSYEELEEELMKVKKQLREIKTEAKKKEATSLKEAEARQSQIEELSNRILFLEQQLIKKDEEYKQQLALAEAEAKKFEGKVAVEQDKYSKMLAELENLERFADANKKAEALKQEKDSLEKQLTEIKGELDEIKTSQDAEVKRLKDLAYQEYLATMEANERISATEEIALDEHNARVDVEEQLRQANRSRSGLKAANTRQSNQIKSLKEEKQTLDAMLVALEGEKDAAVLGRVEAEEKAGQLARDKADLEREAQGLKKREADAITAEIIANQKLKEANAKADEATARAQSAEERAKSVEQLQQRIIQTAQAKKQTIKQLSGEIQGLRAQIQQQQTDFEEKFADVDSQLAFAQFNNTALAKDFEEQQKKTADLEAQLEAKEKQLEEVGQGLEKAVDLAKKLTTENVAIKEQLKAAQTEKENADLLCASAKGELDKLHEVMAKMLKAYVVEELLNEFNAKYDKDGKLEKNEKRSLYKKVRAARKLDSNEEKQAEEENREVVYPENGFTKTMSRVVEKYKQMTDLLWMGNTKESVIAFEEGLGIATLIDDAETGHLFTEEEQRQDNSDRTVNHIYNEIETDVKKSSLKTKIIAGILVLASVITIAGVTWGIVSNAQKADLEGDLEDANASIANLEEGLGDAEKTIINTELNNIRENADDSLDYIDNTISSVKGNKDYVELDHYDDVLELKTSDAEDGVVYNDQQFSDLRQAYDTAKADYDNAVANNNKAEMERYAQIIKEKAEIIESLKTELYQDYSSLEEDFKVKAAGTISGLEGDKAQLELDKDQLDKDKQQLEKDKDDLKADYDIVVDENQGLKDENLQLSDRLNNPTFTVDFDETQLKGSTSKLLIGGDNAGKVSDVLYCEYDRNSSEVTLLVQCEDRAHNTYYNYITFDKNYSGDSQAVDTATILEWLQDAKTSGSLEATQYQHAVRSSDGEVAGIYSFDDTTNTKTGTTTIEMDGLVIERDAEDGTFSFKTTHQSTDIKYNRDTSLTDIQEKQDAMLDSFTDEYDLIVEDLNENE